MILITAIDDNYGMMFNKRRQSQDRILRQHILEITAGHTLWMNAYSQKQFAKESSSNIHISEDFLAEAPVGDYCLVENLPILPYERKIEKIILYHWNRVYPSDVKFDIPLAAYGWKSIQTIDFSGSSHDNITEEIFVKDKEAG
ncbi:MAG: ribonuclease Z [Clostridia bacterium]|nr:ribonuclease Z [Clostridia bacterium]